MFLAPTHVRCSSVRLLVRRSHIFFCWSQKEPDTGLWDNDDRRLWGHNFEERRLWGQTTLRTDDFEDRRLWGQNYFGNVNKIKIDKICKMFQKLSKWLDIWCQHLGVECFYWIYAANIWRTYVILRVSVWGMCIFYWIYAANIWEYM